MITYTKLLLIALLTTTMFGSCQTEDAYDAEQLTIGFWEGRLGVYYQNRWHVTGQHFATEIHFTHTGAYYTSGRGYEVDYDLNSPYENYAYCTFKWFIVDGEITLIYDDDIWSPVYIYNYHLSSSRFSGYINDGTTRDIRFDFNKVASSEWNYNPDGNFSGEFGGYYYARSATRSGVQSNDSVPVIDRTPLCNNQEEGARSILSGTFAK